MNKTIHGMIIGGIFMCGFLLGIPLPPHKQTIPQPAHLFHHAKFYGLIKYSSETHYSLCGKKGPGVTQDGYCTVGLGQYKGWTQSRVTEWLDCSHIYMHCYSDDFKGWNTQIMLESPAAKEK